MKICDKMIELMQIWSYTCAQLICHSIGALLACLPRWTTKGHHWCSVRWPLSGN